jgi:hypothetical protein
LVCVCCREVRIVIGPQALIRYDNRLAITVQGSPAADVSSGQALAAMVEVAQNTSPKGYRGVWTNISLQEKRAEGKTTIILGFALLFAYLFLVGLYERWTIPVSVLLSVSVGVVGAFFGIFLFGLTLAPGLDAGSAAAVPARDDDLLCFHPRPLSVDCRGGAINVGTQKRWHISVRRNDFHIFCRHFCDPTTLRLLPENTRAPAPWRSAAPGRTGRRSNYLARDQSACGMITSTYRTGAAT